MIVKKKVQLYKTLPEKTLPGLNLLLKVTSKGS